MVQLMPLPPHHLLLQKNSEWFTFLVPSYQVVLEMGLLNRCIVSDIAVFVLKRDVKLQLTN